MNADVVPLRCLTVGVVFQPRRSGNGERDTRPFFAVCTCGARVRSERHEVVAQWVDTHRAESASREGTTAAPAGGVDLGGDAA